MDPLLHNLRDELREQACPLCEGLGMRIVDDGSGRRYAERCECRYSQRALRVLERAKIPVRYESCTFETYDAAFPGAHPSLRRAAEFLRKFVEGYPLETNGSGVLITGAVGTGKTHLAVAALRALIVQRAAVGLFCDYGSLLKQVQNTYNSNANETELDVLAPVFNADVLVLDELGSVKRTDWAWEMVAHILNTRYNDRRTTILTTNYPNEAVNQVPANIQNGNASRKSTLDLRETLGDRIGERMFSRIQEMCHSVEVSGKDFRKEIKRPSL